MSYSLLSRHGTAVVPLQCPTGRMQIPLRFGRWHVSGVKYARDAHATHCSDPYSGGR